MCVIFSLAVVGISGRNDFIAESGDVIIRALKAHGAYGGVICGTPELSRPKTKAALGIMSCLRLPDWSLDLV